MRRFELHRDEDETGLSGTGLIVEGVEMSNGAVVMRWVPWPYSIAVYPERGIESIEHLHSHRGRTRLMWLDGEAEGSARGKPESAG